MVCVICFGLFCMWGQIPNTNPPGLYSEGLIFGGFFTFRIWGLILGWAYIWRGLYLEGFIFVGAYIWRGLFSEFYGMVPKEKSAWGWIQIFDVHLAKKVFNHCVAHFVMRNKKRKSKRSPELSGTLNTEFKGNVLIKAKIWPTRVGISCGHISVRLSIELILVYQRPWMQILVK